MTPLAPRRSSALRRCPEKRDQAPLSQGQKEVKAYIARRDRAARMILDKIQTGSMETCYYTADSGTAETVLDLAARSKRLPDRPLTPETMQKADFSHPRQPQARLHDTVVGGGPPNTSTWSGALKAGLPLHGRPRKVWIIELGHSLDTRCLAKMTQRLYSISCCFIHH